MVSHAQSALAHLSLAHDHTLSNREGWLEADFIAASHLLDSFAALLGHDRPSAPAPEAMMQLLMDIKERLTMVDTNLDAIAQDWAQLKPAITSRLTKDSDTIAKLSAELLDSAKSSTPMSDDRAAAIHADMQGVIASLTGTADAVGKVPDPTPPAGAVSATPPVTSTDPTSAGAAAPATPATPTTTSGVPSTSSSGSAPAADPSPAAPPPGAL